MSDEEAGSSKKVKLTAVQKLRIEQNRLKALQIRKAKLAAKQEDNVVKISGTRFVDSGGGFLVEQSIINGENEPIYSIPKLKVDDDKINLPITYFDCIECDKKFAESYLQKNFDYLVCDNCRDPDEAHSLITRTEAKTEYLLKDCDLDKREPLLKFIKRKNPHNVRWGEMKLYLHLQIEQRALDVWGSEEELLKQREERSDKREIGKIKRFNKRMKQLRMDVRSSLYDKTKSASHTHEFGPETYNEEEDNYTHACLTCEYVETFEKM
ncbi:DNA repair protein complementing XP-A cells homolog [Condylostylus longicornis]|uniref:DNA repair protein complementing XP-A cells homolog n=1 Tax=Condylostylus longicornis TaxID=2530218 RepID=UPI00244DFCF4|nr:DNA repair protein complementing XP-A cells homolog [Condylostylus longicornis]XP_055385776.1 DNA repair protein complementing XP-A cells homolog [Condylostylus longicornis]XP_055385777.1 DNA repair protein complementing XP-A cells homolog [Condylostylus longicornis]